MPDLEISNLPSLAEASVQATDPLPIADLSASETKKVTVKDLIEAGVALIDSASIPGTKVGTLGTNQVATAAIQDLAVTTAKIANGAITVTQITDATITGAKLVNNTITATQIAADAIGTSELADNAVDTGAIANNAITNVKINNGEIVYAKLNISDGDIPAAKITGNSITSAQIGANAVGASELADDAVDTAAVVDAAITGAKIATDTIGSGNIAANAIGASELADNAVDTGAIASNAVTTAKIADDQVTAAKLANNLAGTILATGAIGSTQIAADAVTSSELADNAVDTAAIAASAVTDAKVASGISGTKISDGTITPAKLNTSNLNRSLNVASGNLGINNAVTGGAATRSGITYNAEGLITGTAALGAADLPLATTSAVGGVSVGAGLAVTGAGALSLSNSVTGATVSGFTFNNQGMITAATALVAGDLPVATTSAKGAVQITSAGGLTVDGGGNLTTSTSGISAGTYTKVTVNTKGVATAGSTLVASDIPNLAASKITSGSLDAARIGADTIDGTKLSNTSTAIFQSIAQSGYPTAQFNGQILFDTVSEDAFIWDGNAWQAITTLTKGSLVFGGTYNASTSKMASTTTAGIAAGLAVGSNLPSPSSTTDGVYVVVDVAGTPSAPAPVVSLSPPDYILGVTNSAGSSWNEIDLSQTVAGQVASNITFTPYGQLSSTNVQDALQELETEKMGLAGGTVTGQLLIGNTGSLVFEGSTVDAYELTLAVADPQSSDKTITLPDITGTLITTGDTNTVTSTMVDGSLVNTNIAANASIAFSKLAALTSAQIIVGNGSNVPTAVAVTGDISINNAGLTAIASGVIVDGDISGSAAITGSKIATGTTGAVGVLQLTDSATSTSATTAATPAAVKIAKDAADAAATTANAALPKAGGTMTDHLIIDNGKELRLSESDGDGTNYTGLKAQSQSGDITLTLPAVAPTANQVLKADASTPTTLTWAADSATDATKLPLAGGTMSGAIAMGTSKITGLGDPTAAQDAATKTYVDTADALKLNLAGGTLTGNLTLNAQSDVRFADADSSAYVALQAPSTIGSSYTLTLPAADGTNGQALISDGSGNLSFTSISTGAAGSNTQVQFNNSGAFAGSSSLTFNSGTGALTATSFVGALTGNVTGNASGSSGSCTGNAATASLATEFTVTANNTADETVYPLFVDGATGSQGAETDTGLSYNPSSGLLTSTGFVGALTGNVTGNASGSSGSCTGNAATATAATNVTVADESSDTTCFPLFATAATGDLGAKSGSNLTFNSSSGALTATSFVGALTGNVTGNASGSAATVTGAAQSAITSLGTLTGLTVDGDVQFSGAANNVVWDKSDNALEFASNAKAAFGSSSEFKLYNNGTNSYIADSSGTGYLSISAVEFHMTDHLGGKFIKLHGDTTELYYSNDLKLATTNTGATITGTLVADGLTVDTDTLHVDATNNRVGIGLTAPAYPLDILNATNPNIRIRSTNTSTGAGAYIDGGSSHDSVIVFQSSGTNSYQIFRDGSQADDLRILDSTDSTDIIRYKKGASGSLKLGTNTTTALTINSSQNATFAGSVTATSFSGSGANLTNLPASGGTITATTDGALTAGDAVIVKSDGEVTKAQGAFNALSPYTTPDATGVEMVSTDVEETQVIYDEGLSTSLNKLIYWIAYRNQNNSDNIWLGSYNATDNSFDSSPSNAFGSGNIYGTAYDTVNDKLLFTYRDSGGHYDVSSVTTSGISSFTVNDTNMMVNIGTEKAWIDITYVGSSKAIWVGPESTTNGIARVVTIASNGDLSHSSGHNVSVDSGQLKYMRVAGSGNQIVVAYAKGNDSDHGYCRVGTISGTSISFGSETEFGNVECHDVRIGYDSVNDKYLFFYGYNPAKVRVGTVSGTSISFGTAVNISTGAISDGSASDRAIAQMKYNVKSESFTIAYLDTSYGRRIQTRNAKISGTSVTLNTRLDTSQYTTNEQFGLAVGYLSDSVFGSFLAYRYNTGRLRGQELVTMEAGTNLTTENFIGFASANYSDNATATIDVSGSTNSNQSSLTAGQKYFVQNNGSLGLTAASPAVFAGTAISATKLIVNDQQPIPDGGWHLLIKNNFTIDSSHNGNGNSHTITEVLNTTYAKYNFLKLVIFVYVDNNDIDEFGVQHLFDDSTNQYKDSNYARQDFAASNGSDHSAARQTTSAFISFKRMSADQHHAEAVLSLPQQSGLAKVWNVTNMGWRNTLGSDDQHVAHIMGGHKTSTDPLKGIRFRFGSIGGSNSGKCFYRLLGME